MKIIKGQPGSGKTDQLIALALNDTDAIIVVKDIRMRDKVLQKINYKKDIEVITHEDFMEYLLRAAMNSFIDRDPTIIQNVYIDDMELMEQQLQENLSYNIKAITMTEE